MKTPLENQRTFKAKKVSKITCDEITAVEIYKTSEMFCFTNDGIAVLECQLKTLRYNRFKGYYKDDIAMAITIDKAIEQLDSAIDLIKLSHVRAKQLETFAFAKYQIEC